MARKTTRAERFKAQFGIETSSSANHHGTKKDATDRPTSEVISEDSPFTSSEDSSEQSNMDPRFGEVAPSGMRFTPIKALMKFPYKYMSSKYQDTVSDKFFSKGLFWERSWDLYWIRSPLHDTEKALVFVPENQLKDLVDEIKTAFPDYNITIPSDDQEPGFVVEFEDHPDLRPKWLGPCKSKTKYSWLESQAHEFDMPPEMPSETQRAYFKKKMADAADATKQKSKFAKDKRQEERLAKQKNMSRAFRRAQRYLGLSPTTTSEDLQHVAPEIDSLNVHKTVPFAFDSDVIIIAVDVEAYEKSHHIITEIGVATLDTRSLRAIPPGDCGINWRTLIQARHFRIGEYMHLRNGQYVAGCPENFSFGESEIISKADAAAKIAECFKPPYSNACPDPWDKYKKRNIIFLGHDTQTDVKFLQQVGYDVNNLDNLLEFQDTATMYRVLSQEPNPRSLAHLLDTCEVDAWFLHNAGNDAMFTIQAMLGLCVKDAVENRGGNKEEKNKERELALSRKIAEAKVEAEQQIVDAVQGWDLDDGDDGGVPCRRVV